MIYTLNGTQLTPGKAFTHPDGRQFAGNWLRYTKATRDRIGIVETAETVDTPFDRRFYSAPEVEKDLAEVKAVFLAANNQSCSTFLNATDWYVIRKTEKDVAIPDSVVTYRDAVRAANAARANEINAASDIDALKALVDSTENFTQYPPRQ